MTSRKQGKNRSRLKRIIDNRRAKREERRELASADHLGGSDFAVMSNEAPADLDITKQMGGLPALAEASYEQATLGAVFKYRDDSNECWAAAKRRKQGKLKTWALWQTHMEDRGYYFRTEDNVLSVYKNGVEVGQVSIFGTGPDA